MFKNKDIFSPYIIIVAIIAYLLMAYVAFHYKIRGLNFPSPISIIYISIGSLFYILGVLTSSNLKSSLSPKVKIEFSHRYEPLLLIIAILSIILVAWNLYNVGGIPLFSGYLKAKALTGIWFISYLLFLLSINLLLARFKKDYYYGLFILGLTLFALTGYRTTTVVILLSVLINLYYTRNIPLRQLTIIGILTISLTIIIGYIAVKSIEWQHWTLNPIELFFYRAGYTLTVFDRLIQFEGATRGKLLYSTLTGFLTSTDPRIIVGTTVLGYKHSSTSTIFGPATLDFGFFAMIIQMFIIGLILGLLHTIQKIKKDFFTALYAIILAHTLVWIETGPTDLVVWIFYLMAVAVIIKEACHESGRRS
ncbi:MAG TPA: oligosaccharide repeat unit polymerase [Methanothermobacter sp.]|uniref:Oligosaccharide repeat unit polymerase n=1 Tax=Methanothermobacter tenebrarum TaxID=680118 RepID=A0ABM7YBH8_9EURY|nr:oligosaccharide repeat unit polymerase family protein [Methanothermobacter tenebrarum]MDD3454816.1 oligosaccharide repeat unit polymerase family protein [Methanobacteriales archaeon]MDI6882594.1 oligosaccharide repeat unit polymerase family protein [Methanothermobacter sp.]MDX9693864.1 oligosaccharide repeat unit polymerase family protein [Methanothermobacter sp.]BDH78658.1 oligosaccharide repeat unit polymerase [Methanothermobacter tenebrarum]HHW16334.1 oligosaccharide repeat unit polymera